MISWAWSLGRYGCRGMYFRDPDGHLMEILTRPAR